MTTPQSRPMSISMPSLEGKGVLAWVVFVHGSGSSHLSSRNQRVARHMNSKGYATLLFDLLTSEEAKDRRLVFDVTLLTTRLLQITDWLKHQKQYQRERIVYFGASTGAAAALQAASMRPREIFAVISRGGRTDLAHNQSHNVDCPVLMIAGSKDEPVIRINLESKSRLKNAELMIIPGATHLFEEPGALDQVSEKTVLWLDQQIQNKEILTQKN